MAPMVTMVMVARPMAAAATRMLALLNARPIPTARLKQTKLSIIWSKLTYHYWCGAGVLLTVMLN